MHDVHDVGIGRAIAIGLAQTLALVPGTSRSGITISAGLFTGLDRSTAATFAFFLGLPVTIAAGFLETLALARAELTGSDLAVLAIGVGSSFVGRAGRDPLPGGLPQATDPARVRRLPDRAGRPPPLARSGLSEPDEVAPTGLTASDATTRGRPAP